MGRHIFLRVLTILRSLSNKRSLQPDIALIEKIAKIKNQSEPMTYLVVKAESNNSLIE